MTKFKYLFDKRMKSLFQQASAPTVEKLIFETKKSFFDHANTECIMSGVSTERYMPHDIVVSLTTYGKRIWDVYLAIESIMQQTLKPNRILLNLDYSFKGAHLPITLQRQMNRGLEINYCKDIRSYKKLIPTLLKYPDDAIVTIDDDLVYDNDILEKLINSYQTDNHSILAARVLKIEHDVKRRLLPYREWKIANEEIEPIWNFLTGGGGTLYPPHCLDEEIFNQEAFMRLCPYGDDIWFTVMAKLKGTSIKKIVTRHTSGNDFTSNPYIQDIGLCVENNSLTSSRNDVQIKATFREYKIDKLLGIKL